MRDALPALALYGGLGAVALAAWLLGAPFTITLTTRIAILALAATGLNLALGLGGLVSLGHAVFFGIGGYAMGVLASHAQTYDPILDWPIVLGGTTSMPLIWLVAIAASGLAALLIGLVTLRTSGVYFIMITLAFGQMAYYFAISWPAYGGEDGLSIWVRNGFPGMNTLDPIQFFALAWGLLGLAGAGFAHLRSTSFGLALSAARQAPARAEAAGRAPRRVQLLAFVLSGMVTGLAGALMADLNRFVSPSMLSWHLSGELIVLCILGGVGRSFGPLAGAALFVTAEHWLGGVWDYWQILLGLLLLGVVLWAPGGLLGAVGRRPHG